MNVLRGEAVATFVITDRAIPDDEVVELVLAGEVGHEMEEGVLALSQLAEDEGEAVGTEDAHGFGDPGLAPGEVGVGSWPLGIPGFIFENVEVGGVGDDGLGDGVGEFLEFREGVALEQLGHFLDRIDRISGLTGFCDAKLKSCRRVWIRSG